MRRTVASRWAIPLVCIAVLGLCGCAQQSIQESIISVIETDPRLLKAYEWTSRTRLLEGFKVHKFDKITIMLPSNQAFERFEAQHPDIHRRITQNRESIETLILFGSTDTLLEPQDILAGEYAEEDSIVSLLAEYASIQPNGRACISDYTRTEPCDSPHMTPCCGTLDFGNVIRVDEGYIYIVDEVLLPQELFDQQPS